MKESMSQQPPPTLVIENLSTQFFSRAGTATAVNEVSFSVAAGQIMGLVGESGSGKSMTGYSIMGLIDPPGKVVSGSIRLKGEELFGQPQDKLRQIRGNRIAMIFQDPMMTLNPVLRIDTQMVEAVLAHQNVGKRQALHMASEALEQVGIASPAQRLLCYPHQFSGGMRQRVAIAIALLNKPDVIICDEPTTALDVTIQSQILYEMQKLCRESGTALIWITHDLSVVAGLADTMCVMYAGRVVESGSVEQVLEQTRHPYTQALIASAPSRNKRGQPIAQIPGMAPSLLDLPPGCAFQARCQYVHERCQEQPALQSLQQHTVRCFRPLSTTTAMPV